MDIVGSLGYIGQDILFTNNECFAYLTGNAVYLYDVSKGPRELVWKTETGVSCFATNFECRSMIFAPIVSKKFLEVVNFSDLTLRLTLDNPFDVPVIHVSFSRDGDKVFAITDTIDHKLLLWSINENKSRLLISKKLEANYKVCSVNPCSSDYVCCYGDSGLMIGYVTEVLESYSVKCTSVDLFNDEFDTTEYTTAENERTILFAIWIPGNRLLVAVPSGAIYEVSCDSKKTTRLLGKFTVPEKRGKTIIKPTHAVLSLNNIIIGTKEGIVYWYPLINLMPVSHQEMIVDFNNPLQVSSISKSSVSCLTIDPKFQILLIGTCSGEICKLPIEVQEKEILIEAELDQLPTTVETIKSTKIETIQAEILSNENRDGIILCTSHMCMDVLKFSARSRSTLSMFVTGSHSGNIRFWRHNASQVVEGMIMGAGIRRSVPRSLKSMFHLNLINESSQKAAAICLIEFVLLPLKHTRLVCIGTDDGYLQVWSMDAQENEDEDARDVSDDTASPIDSDGVCCKSLEDDEGGCNVRLEMRKIFQTKFYDGVLSMITFMPITNKNVYNLKAAIASECSGNIYIINFLTDDSVVLNNGVETHFSLDNNEVPLSMLWSNNQLFVFNEHGSVYIFNSTDKINLSLKTKIIPNVVYSSLTYGAVDTVVLLNNTSFIHTCNINDLKYNSTDSSRDVYRNFKHDDTVVCVAQAPSGKYFASGCVDGSVYIWKLVNDENNIVLANKIKLHSNSVSSLSYSSDSSLLFTCGIDGSCFIATLDKPAFTEKAVLRGNYPKGEEPQYISEIIPDTRISLKQQQFSEGGELTWIEMKKMDEAKDQKSKHKFKALGISGAVNEIAQRLNVLVQQNSERNELEILDRSEFVIDVKRKDDTVNSNLLNVKRLNELYSKMNYRNELLAARLRTKCWDNLEIKPNNIYSCLAPTNKSFSISSLSIQKYSAEQIVVLQKVKRLRAIEIRSQKMEDLGVTSRIHGTPYYRCAWSTSLLGCPSSVSWISNDGTRWPISDKIASLLINEKALTKDNNANANKEGVKGLVVTSNEEDDGSLASDDEIHDIDESNILNLIYPPQAVRTQVQRRTQIILLREIIRQMRLKFNEQFDSLRREKEDIISSIESRNLRMQVILEDLHNEEELFSPSMVDSEIVGSAIHVNADELSNRPYESEIARISRLKEEEEKRLLELQKDKEDIKGRALDEMMHGTLEVKRDVMASASSTLIKPEWMDTLTPHEMNESQLKEHDLYQTNLRAIHEEQASYRKTLELEMKKLKLEITELCKSFDEKLEELSNLKVLVLREILSQEIYVCRLSLNMAKAEQSIKFMAKSEEQVLALRADRADLKYTIDKLSVQLEDMKGKINSIQEEERQMDKSFRRDLQNLCNNTFDQNSLKILTQLYRQRTYPAGGYEGGTDEMDEDHSEIDASASAAKSNNRSKSMGARKSSNNRSQSKKGGLSSSHTDVNKGKKLKASKGINASGNNNGNKDASLGPMQLAAQALKSAETEEMIYKEKDPYYEALLVEERQRLIKEASIPIMSQLSLESDCPEGFDIDQFSWSKLQELRTARIEKEIEGKVLSIEFSKLKQKLEHFDNEDAILANCINEIKQSRDLSYNVLKELDSNLEVTVRLLQGQDEVNRDAVVTNYSDALLIPINVVGKFNSRIKELGKEKIGVLSKIKLFRRKINLIDWEAKHHGFEARHYEAYLTDLQLFRVTRELQKVIREGKDSNQAKVNRYIIFRLLFFILHILIYDLGKT